MKLTEAFRLTIQAYKWYVHHDCEQYTDGPLDLYDTAAQLLTARKELACHLAHFLGNINGNILEIAAGTGLVSEYIEDCGKLTCIDISFESLQRLQTRVRNSLIAAANFYNLPFTNNSFDTVINVGGYRYVDSSTDYWNEMDRILHPEGRLIIIQFYPSLVNIKGRDIADETEQSPSLKLKETSVIPAMISIRGITIQSGCYKLFEFSR